MDRPIIRGTLALLVGLPVTVVLGWIALLTTIQAIVNFLGFFVGATFGGGDFAALIYTVRGLIWGPAGLCGVLGFWIWVFAPRPLAIRTAHKIILGLSLGIGAAVPLLISPGDLLQAFAALGTVAAVIVITVCFLTSLSSRQRLAPSPQRRSTKIT